MDNTVATSQENIKGANVYKDNTPKTLTPNSQNEMPLEIYSQEHQNPYVFELLDVGDTLPEETKVNIGTIDQYINRLLETKGLKSTTEAYRHEFSSLKRSLGISNDSTIESTIERISKYIDAEKMIKGIKGMDEDRILYLLKKAKTGDLMKFVLKEIEKKGL